MERRFSDIFQPVRLVRNDFVTAMVEPDDPGFVEAYQVRIRYLSLGFSGLKFVLHRIEPRPDAKFALIAEFGFGIPADCVGQWIYDGDTPLAEIEDDIRHIVAQHFHLVAA